MKTLHDGSAVAARRAGGPRRRRARWTREPGDVAPLIAEVLESFGEHDVASTPDEVAGSSPCAGGSAPCFVATDRDDGGRAARTSSSPHTPRRRGSCATRAGTGTSTSTAPTTPRGTSGWHRRRRWRWRPCWSGRRSCRGGSAPPRAASGSTSTTGAATRGATARRRAPPASGSAATGRSARMPPGRASIRRCQRDGVRARARGSSSNIQRAKLRRPQSPAAGEDADRPARPRSWASTRPSARRHAVVGDEVVAHRAVRSAARDRGGVERPGGEDRLGGEPPGEQRLADALARHHVGRHRRVAGEQHPAVGQRRPVDARRGSATPCAGPRARAAGRAPPARAGGRAARPTARFMSWIRRVPSRSTPKPTLARPSGSGNDHA